MFIKIPFEQEIEFKTNVNEITKMSLEHDYNINDGVVLGNFYISGEYRVYEVSVTKEPFNFTLPFTVELRDDIKNGTLEFNIEDFSYEILENKKLKVNIEYSLQAEIKEEELFERVDEVELESELAFIDDFFENEDDKVLEKENYNETEEIEFIGDEKKEERAEVIENEVELSEKTKEDVLEDERIGKEEEKTIMETIKTSDDTFVTYHVHVVKENETKESICALYSVSNDFLSEYNNLDNISMGDKILIPKIDE